MYMYAETVKEYCIGNFTTHCMCTLVLNASSVCARTNVI